jgi:hypothetical protein
MPVPIPSDLSKLSDAELEALRAQLQKERDAVYARQGEVCREQEHRRKSATLQAITQGMSAEDKTRLLGTVKP